MSGYIGSTPVPQATQHRESFTCTEGQTTFNTAGYTPQFVDVYLNGSHLSPADFTATNGSDVVLGVAASADDVCDIISYTPFEVADATFTGTTNLDAVDIDGAVQIDATLSVGVNDTGYDVKFFGATASAFMQWDASTDDLILGGVSNFGAGTATPQTRIHSTSSQEQLTLSEGNGKGATFDYRSSTGNLNIATNGGNARSTPQITLDLNGAVTMPLQPAFLARPASQQSNIAINATTTIVFGTEIFDQNADFASNTFTAPVTGKYQLNVQLMIQQMDKDTDFLSFSLVTSNRSYQVYWDNDTMAADSPNGHGINIVVLADMDASDTAYVNVAIPNSGAAQMDVTTSSAFSGYLVA